MSSSGEYDLSDLKILVVDDSDFMLGLLIEIFEGLGCKTVIAATDGKDAIDKINTAVEDGREDSLFDVVFTDWAMEPMDGLKLLKWVRDHPNPEVR